MYKRRRLDTIAGDGKSYLLQAGVLVLIFDIITTKYVVL